MNFSSKDIHKLSGCRMENGTTPTLLGAYQRQPELGLGAALPLPAPSYFFSKLVLLFSI